MSLPATKMGWEVLTRLPNSARVVPGEQLCLTYLLWGSVVEYWPPCREVVNPLGEGVLRSPSPGKVLLLPSLGRPSQERFT